VTAKLPERKGEFQYQIRHARELHERIARKGDIPPDIRAEWTQLAAHWILASGESGSSVTSLTVGVPRPGL
jgi:hypothetical protein